MEACSTGIRSGSPADAAAAAGGSSTGGAGGVVAGGACGGLIETVELL